MKNIDLENGWEAWRQEYGQCKIGYIEVKGMHHSHDSGSSLEIRVWKANDKQDGYGDVVFDGTLEGLVERLEAEGK